MTTLSDLLQATERGDPSASKQLFAALYDELHQLAEHQLRKRGGQLTLGTTTLLHEAYLALSKREPAAFPDRSRFLAYASKAMRGLIVDYARARGAKKRGGDFEITRIGDEEPGRAAHGSDKNIERLGHGLEELSAIDPDLAQIVDLHFFCGFSFVEIGALRGVSDRTVQRDWRKARMLLQRAFEPE